MNNDLKATVTAIVTAVLGLLTYFNVVIPQEVGAIITAILVVILGYFINKKDN